MDDDFVFDESFVQGAIRKEGTAEERLATAQRVARGHAAAQPFRGPVVVQLRAPRRRRRRTALVVLVSLAVTGGMVYLKPSLIGRDVAGTTLATDQPSQPHPPRPADASSHRLLPVAVPPPGKGGYQLLTKLPHDGQMVRFSPCQPIHFVVRHDLEPLGGPAAITRAFDEISRDTGLLFVNDGSTDEAPAAHRPLVDPTRYGDRWSPVLVAWATVAEAPELAGDVDGYAGPDLAEENGLHLVTAQVVLDEAQLTDPAGVARPEAYLTVLHELGHALGLAHVTDDPAALMYPELRHQQGFGPGDLRGLAFVGSGPCGQLGH